MKASLSPDGSSPEDILQQSAQHEGVVAGGPSTSETLFRHKPDQQPLGTDETLFQSIAANVPGMVYQFLLHPDGTVEWPFISEGCRAIYEKEPDELRRNPSWVIDIIHPDDRAEFHRSVAASAETLLPWTWEGRHQLPSGKLRWIQGASRPRRLPDGSTLWDGLVMDITARKEAETERDRFFEISLDILCIATPRGYFKRVNPAFARTLGWSEEELLSRPVLDFIHPEDIEATLTETDKLQQGIRTLHFENRYRCRDGSYRWFAWDCVPFLEEGLLYAVAHDITEQRQQQHTLQLMVNLNQATQPLTDPDEIMSVTAQMLGEHLRVNRCAYAEVGPDEDSFLLTGNYTRDTFSIVGEFTMSSFGDEVLRLMREGQPYIVEDVGTDPRAVNNLTAYHQTEIVAVVCVPLHKDGRFAAAMAVHQKVARRWSPEEVELIRLVVNRCWEALERARAARHLRESEARLRFMAESMPQKIFTAGASGEVDYFNQQWMEFTGLSFEQIRDWGWTQFIHPDDVAENVRRWQHSINTGELFELEHRFRRADGRYRWHLSRAHPMRDSHGKVLMWIGSNTDIDDVKRVEEEKARLLVEAQEANRLKDEFLATMSHELRTPLTAILGWAHLLRATNLDPESAANALEIIERNARSQVRLIDDLLDLSRIITGKLRLDVQPIALASVVEAAADSVRPTAETRGIRLQVLLDPQAGPVSGDPERLQQVIWNLLSNAIKFTPKGGRVQVRLERVNSHVEITVSDTGQGISAEFLPHVFDRFRQADATNTRAHGGLGLGLAIVHQLVELHGGLVQVTSPGAGQGTTFRVILPLTVIHQREKSREGFPQDTSVEQRVHPRAGDAVAFDCPAALSGLRVLVVDDEKDARNLIQAVLQQCNAVVLTASSASEGLDVLQRLQPDILISDIGMPEEDGYSLIKKVRALPSQQGGRIPAVALTAYARAEDRIKALASGFQMHAPKPIEPAELAAIVASLAQWIGKI
jgi:PAS domain S-box-containing protein